MKRSNCSRALMAAINIEKGAFKRGSAPLLMSLPLSPIYGGEGDKGGEVKLAPKPPRIESGRPESPGAG
jgi:hypothetical protein